MSEKNKINSNNKAVQILKSKQLRLTKCRQQLISLMLEQTYAVTHAELERKLDDFDRVTVYRTLHIFLEKGILHKVADDDATGIKYAICETECPEHQHYDQHIHFKCTTCQHIQCLYQVHLPPINLPQGYTATSASCLIRGICVNCHAKNKGYDKFR